MTGRGYHVLSVIARLKPGVSVGQARADIDLIARRLAHQYPENAEETRLRTIPEIERLITKPQAAYLVWPHPYGLGGPCK
jgi:hypothetical protein